jgi:hypothetical protein
MSKIKRSIDPYPKFSSITLAGRVSYESPNEKIRTISASDFKSLIAKIPDFFFYGD